MSIDGDAPGLLERLTVHEVHSGAGIDRRVDESGRDEVEGRPRRRFVSAVPADGHHVYGGWLVAAALAAAEPTVTTGSTRSADSLRPVHTVRVGFLAAGIPGTHLDLVVDAVRDGRSFSTRRVTVTQRGAPVLDAVADFHAPEPGVDFATPGPGGIPGPEGLGPGRYDNPLVESRDVPPGGEGRDHARRAWFRVRDPLPDDPAIRRRAIAYLSDFGATRAAREPHAHLADDARRLSVSLDHTLWFHADADPTGWLLSELAPVATGGGRGLVLGHLWTAEGTLVATVAQQALLRERR